MMSLILHPWDENIFSGVVVLALVCVGRDGFLLDQEVVVVVPAEADGGNVDIPGRERQEAGDILSARIPSMGERRIWYGETLKGHLVKTRLLTHIYIWINVVLFQRLTRWSEFSRQQKVTMWVTLRTE